MSTKKYFPCMIAALLALGATSPLSAQTAYPMLMSIKPTAAQVGQTTEHVVNSRYSLAGAYQVLVSGSGVTGEIALPAMKTEDLGKKTAELTKLPVRFTVAVGAQPGVRDFRIVTPRGVSTTGQLVIGRDPIVEEKGNNDAATGAQEVSLPATICGTIEKAEDVDFYKFHVAEAKTITFHVRSARLQDRIHDLQAHSDPILTLRTAAGGTIAASDNHYYADPLLSHRFEPGDYLLEIRDVRYTGNQYWEYSIEASDRPLVETVFPLAVAPGKEVQLELIGFQLPENPMIACSAPMDMPLGPQELQLPMGDQSASPVPVIITDLPLVTEAADDNNSLGKAAAISVPCGINGRIEREADVDCYTFEAKKGEAFNFEIVARRRQSSLDSYLRILNDQGKQLALSDDLKLGKRASADSWLENWTAPADGKYTLELRDVHLRGGSQFPYFLQVTRSLPYFELYLDTDKTQVGPGGCGVIFVRVERKGGFTGGVDLAIEGLPHGVTAYCGKILPGKPVDGCIVLEAEHDAPLGVGNIVVTGIASHELPEGEPLKLSAIARPYQETYQPGGGRGHWPVDTHAVAVTEYGDIRSVQLSTYDVSLKPGDSQRIGITIERGPGFSANVSLDMVFQHLAGIFANTLPVGVTLDDKQSQSLLTGETVEGHLTLKAASDAPAVEKQQCAVMGHVSLNFVMKATYASKPLSVTVVKP